MTKRRIKIVPYRRGTWHRQVAVRGSDGFSIYSYPYSHSAENFLQLASLVGRLDQYKPVVEESLKNNSYFSIDYRTEISPNKLIENYLYEKSKGSFAISHYPTGPGAGITIGFRDNKDEFSFALKFGGMQKVNTWNSDTPFTVFIVEDDPFVFSPVYHKARDKADPLGVLDL